jgi:hypothetical protein
VATRITAQSSHAANGSRIIRLPEQVYLRPANACAASAGCNLAFNRANAGRPKASSFGGAAQRCASGAIRRHVGLDRGPGEPRADLADDGLSRQDGTSMGPLAPRAG